MFTGIIEEVGEVLYFREEERAWRMKVAARQVPEGIAEGESIAVNGCCLTVTGFGKDFLLFDLLRETINLTSFLELKPGDPVNLESSLRFGGKVGGHFVSGHVDGVGEIDVLEARGKDGYLHVLTPREFHRLLVYKGSVAVDGISLTLAEVDEVGFAVWLIPHTLENTDLAHKKKGSRVNLEFDLLGKYVDRLLEFRK